MRESLSVDAATHEVLGWAARYLRRIEESESDITRKYQSSGLLRAASELEKVAAERLLAHFGRMVQVEQRGD